MTGRDECRNFCPENSRKNRKKGLQNRNIHAIIPGVSTRRRTGIGMSPSGKAPDFDSGISSVQIRPSQPYDLLAQSAEQLPFKQWVRGSNPRRVTKEKHHPVGWCFSLVRFRSAVQIVRLRRIYSKAGKPDKGFPCKHPFPCGKWKILHLFCQRFTDKETEDPQWFPGFPFIFNSLRAYQNCKDIAGISTKDAE